MPTLSHEAIYTIAREVLGAAGASDVHASVVGRHLADANMAGHDSHGFLRIPQYVKEIDDGVIDPKSSPAVVRENAAVAHVDGHGTFGQVVAGFALDLGMQKAREHGIALVNMCNLGHTGRVGTYPERAAREGMAAIMCTGFVGGHSAINLAPFGGRERRLGTNPIAMSFPSSGDSPVLLDFATSIAAEGKLRVYKAKGEMLPDEWVLDKNGVPSRDPNDYYEGGSLLPIGGVLGGHKGYALSFMVALFGAVMGGIACPGGDVKSQLSGSTIIVMDVGGMAPIDEVGARVDEVVDYVKSTPLAEGSSGILYPGEMEARSRRQRLKTGVPVADATWDEVSQVIDRFNLTEKLGPLAAGPA
jgi:uncharacterized oxidoreductase